MRRLSRRALMQAGLAAGMAPLLPAGRAARGAPAALPAEVDVAIVGAGMAGLAAAQLLAERNRSVAVLEARDRIGGRIWTDSSQLGVPVDLGAAALHSADINPLVAELRRREVRLQPDDGDFWLFDRDAQGRGRDAELLDYDSLGAAYDRIDDALADAKVLRADVPLASRVKLDNGNATPGVATAAGLAGRWSDLARALAGPLHQGVEFAQVAALDAPRLAGTGNEIWLPGGMGGWLADYARRLPVYLSRKVVRIEWSGSGVLLATAEGQLRAEACIVTLPAGLLADGIVFQPGLPEVQREALGRLGMGLLDRIALLYEPGSFEAPVNTQALARITAGRDPGAMAFRLNVQAQPLAVAMVGGDYARRLEAAGEAAAIAAARAQLKMMLGDDIDRRFVRGAASAWGRDPLSRGAVCVARPGFTAARRLAGRALAGPAGRVRVLFAGEAFAPADWTGSVTGAWLSGRQAATEALRMLG
ncbi:flavin monoamine oxidase family protein [Ferrovibrio sp.]|uniref:flavin monoamine oxidase family protein n=1 Tax=Ferrovibrio sp. TaxID=1917215 RepID=UPI003516A6A3